MNTRNKPTPSGNPPVYKIRHGALSASVWRQDTEKGPMFNVSFQRSYKDGEEWKTSTSFGQHDLLLLSFMATQAFQWISEQQQPDAPTR